jgi:hypothetical protein
MALSQAGKWGGVPVRGFAEAYPYSIILDADESAPALSYQDGGLVTTFSRSSDGVYVCTLSHRYERIVVVSCNVRKNGDWTTTIIPVEGNAAANTLTVYTRLAGTLDDPDVEVDIAVRLVGAHHHPNSGVGAVAAS